MEGKTESSICCASGEDLDQIRDWNKMVPEASEAYVDDLIAENIRKQPDAPAIDAWDGQLTYSQLGELSTRLACHLTGLGVGLEVIVP